jgi:threonine dehydrogenase-like Zn-dependent dehydrogenase
MPRELVALAPRQAALREYDLPPLKATDVRIKTEFASPKHGTELNIYRGHQRVLDRGYDEAWGCLMPRTQAQQERLFPRPLGNMAVGMVTEVGNEATRFQPGDVVFGHFPIREVQTVDEARVFALPPGLSPEAAVCLDPAVMALAARDAGIKLGDRVAVFGMGAIGLMAVQLAKLAGAAQVIAVDPIARRRELAERYGAHAVIEPGEDAGLAIRRLTQQHAFLPGLSAAAAHEQRQTQAARPAQETSVLGGYKETPSQSTNLGVDVSIEASGSTHALQDAIRATRFGGTICLLSYYGGEALGVRLGEEFHVNRLSIVSCRAESLPMRDAPGWTLERLAQTALDWLVNRRLQTEGMVTPVVPFEACADAYREIDEHPERSIKLGVRFG